MAKVRQLSLGIANVEVIKGIKGKKAIPEKKDKDGKVIQKAVPEVKAVAGGTHLKFTINQNYAINKGTTFRGKTLKYKVTDVDTSDKRATLFTAKCAANVDADAVYFDLNGGAIL